MQKKYKQKIIRRVVTKSNPVYKTTNRKKKLKIFFSVLFIIVIGFISNYLIDNVLIQKFSKNNFFNIKDIQVNVEGKLISQNLIVKQSELKLGTNIFCFSSSKLKDNLKKLNPEIKEIKIIRWLPDKIKININERIPIGILVYNGNLYYVDADGAIFHKIENISTGKIKLPLITGIKITRDDIKTNKKNFLLVKAIETIEKIKNYDIKFLNNISEVNIQDIDKVILYTLEEGLKIKIDDNFNNEKIAYLNKILPDLDKPKVKYIDLRFNDKVFVGY